MPDMARYDPFSPTPKHPLLNSTPDYGSRTGAYNVHPVGDIGPDLGPQITFRDRNKHLRKVDDEKNKLIEDLIFAFENAQYQLEQIRVDYSRESQYYREGQLQEKGLKEQLQQVKQVMNQNPFIIILIDAGSTFFTENLLAQGEKGGQEAAHRLCEAALEFAKSNLPPINSPKVVARIYADVKNLTEALLAAKVISRPSVLIEFIRGFNSTGLSFDIVDCGSQRHTAKDKVIEALQSYLCDYHCRQIMVGMSQEADVSQLLDSTTGDALLFDHVTLIESVPIVSEMDSEAVKLGFRKTKFDKVFSDNKRTYCPIAGKMTLQAEATSSQSLPTMNSVGTNVTNSTSSTPALTWASMTAQPFVPSAVTAKQSTNRASTPLPTKVAELKPVKSERKSIERNRLGQRVDKVDDTIPTYEIQRIKKLKLCNVFYLQDPSQCDSSSCSHSHGYTLSKNETKILREVARMTPCYYQMDCEDPECIYGHRCPQSRPGESKCWYGEECRFWGWGHGIDTRIVKTTKV